MNLNFKTDAMQISSRLSLLLRLDGCKSAPPVILCIGSDRVTGDCLGPLTGQLLKERFSPSAYIYGTLSSPVTAVNLKEALSFIGSNHTKSTVIAVDSALGKLEDVGKIRVISGGIFPGAATGKTLPKVGDIALTATVAALSKNALYGVRLGFIHSLADTIAFALNESLINTFLSGSLRASHTTLSI